MDAARQMIAAGHFEVGAHIEAKLLNWVGLILNGVGENIRELLGRFRHVREEEDFFVLEMVVDGGASDLGASGDLRHGDGVEGLLGEELSESVEELLARQCAVVGETFPDDFRHSDILTLQAAVSSNGW